MLIVIIALTVDSQIGYIADFIPQQLSSNGGIAIFVALVSSVCDNPTSYFRLCQPV